MMTSTNGTQSFWPSLPEVKKGPLAILKEQALWLTKGTDNLVRGWVTPISFEYSGEEVETSYGLHHIFYLRVPALDDYLYKLFSLREEGEHAYPLGMSPHEEVYKEILPLLKQQGIYCLNGIIRINDEGQLVETLKAVFAAPHTQQILGNLLGKVQ